MELTVNIKEEGKIATFLNLIKEIDYIEIVNVKEAQQNIPIEHKDLLDKRLQRINNNEASFKGWDLIRKKYESNPVPY